MHEDHNYLQQKTRHIVDATKVHLRHKHQDI